MYCDYKIESIMDLGNKVNVKGYFSEGEYQDIEGANTYIRTNRLESFKLMFEHSPVTDEEIKRELKRGLEDIKGSRVIIDECF